MSGRRLLPLLAAALVCGCGQAPEPAKSKQPSRKSRAAAKVTPTEPDPASTPIRKIMIELSEGDESVMTELKRQLFKNPIAWSSVQEQAEKYAGLTNELAEHEPPRGTIESWTKSTSGYASLAAQLVEAAKLQDAEGVRDVQRRIGLSCIACHREHHSSTFPGAAPDSESKSQLGQPGDQQGQPLDGRKTSG